MNQNKLSAWLFYTIITLLVFPDLNCAKPYDPEVLNPNICTGGYSVAAIFSTPGYSQDVVKVDTLCYLTQGEGGLLIVNVKDALKPDSVSLLTENVRGYSTKIANKDSVIYIAAGSYGVTVINVADPYNPVVTVSNLNMKPAKHILISGNYLFTSISEQGVKISEISYPTQPDIRGVLNTRGYAQGTSISSDELKLFAACGEMGFSIFDISDFQDGYGTYPLIGWCDTEDYAESVVIDENRSLAFLACGKAGLQIVDYSNSSKPKIIGQYTIVDYAKELIYEDNKIYMTNEDRGLLIIDVSNASEPSLIGSVDSEKALGLDMDQNYIYVADEVQGLIIVNKKRKIN